jgi:ankyrin repeat protein
MILHVLRQSRISILPCSFQELAVRIDASMPEWYYGEHTQTVSILLGDQESEILPEYIKVMMYGLSNGSRFLDRAQWDIFSSMLRENMSDLEPNLRQLRSHSITIRAFLEKIFQAEIYWATQIDDPTNHHKDYLPDRSLDIIKMLLESGQDPNCCVGGRNIRLATPIGRALNIGHVDLAELLLSFNVRIDDTQASFDGYNAIQTILRGRLSNAVQSRLLKLLKEYQAVSLEEVLCGALKLDDMGLIEGILQEDIDVTKTHIEKRHWLDYQLPDRNNCLDYESPLTTSLGGNCHLTKKLLNHPSVQKNPSQVLSVEIFIAAAIRGDCQIINQLQELSPSGLTYKWNGITCLRAAVAYNNLPVAQSLLEPNVRASPDLVLIAAHYGYEDMVRLLLQYGLSSDEIVNKGDVQWLEYFASETLIPKDCSPILQTLLKARFKRWNTSKANCLTLLIEGGARFLGGEIARLAEIGFQEPLQAALTRGISPNDQDEDGRTAIQCALYPDKDLRINRSRHSNTSCEVNKRYGIIKLLLEAGAKQVGEVVNAIRESDYNVTKLLLENGGTLNDIDERGASCLEALIMNSNNISFLRADNHYHHDHYPFRYRGTMRDDNNVQFGVQDGATIACPTCAASWLDSGSDERDFLQALLEAQDGPIDAGPICAAIQVKDWDLLNRLLVQPHKETNCHLLEGTAIGLAARAGQMRILEKLLSRFHHPSAILSGFTPFYVVDGHLALRPNDDVGQKFDCHPWVYDTNDFWRKDPVFGLRGVASPLALAALGEDASGFEALLAHGCCADKTTITVIAQKESASVYLNLLRKDTERLDNLFPSQSTLCSVLLGPIRSGNIELLNELVDAGSDVNDYDATIDRSRSPLQLSAEVGDLGMVHYLVEKQADVNSPPSFWGGATALQFAAIGGYMGIAKLLLDCGARINARGSRRRGRTALEGAAERGRLDMIELLLQRGAAWADSGRQQFNSAVRLALENAHYAVVDWLKDRYGWTEEDEDFLNNGMDDWLYWDDRCKNCRDSCCDEIHGSEDDCIYYYPEDKEEEWAAECYYCKLEWIEDCESQDEGDEASDQWPKQKLEDDAIFFEPWVSDYSLFFD